MSFPDPGLMVSVSVPVTGWTSSGLEEDEQAEEEREEPGQKGNFGNIAFFQTKGKFKPAAKRKTPVDRLPTEAHSAGILG